MTIFVLFLIYVFTSLFLVNPVMDTNRLLLAGLIVVILLTYRFKEFEIPGILKLSAAVESVKEETKQLRQTLMNVTLSSTSIARSNANANLNLILNRNPSGPEVTQLRNRVPVEDRTDITDEQVIRNLFSRGDYLASISLLWNFIYDEIRRGLDLRRMDIPTDFKKILILLQEHSIFNLDLIDGMEQIDELYTIIKSRSQDSFSVNREKLENTINFGIALYYNIKHTNDNFGTDES